MAILDRNKDPYKRSTAPEGVTAPQGQGVTAPQGQGVATPQGQTPSQTAPKGSGSATNLRKYIEANKPTMAGRVGQEIEKQEKRESNRFEGIRSAFDKSTEDAQKRLDQGEEFQQQIGQMGGAQGIVQDPEAMQQFKQLRTGFTGDISQAQPDLTAATQGVQGLQQRAKATETEAGRFGLLRDLFGSQRPGYTGGQQRLDQLLLQAGGPGGSRALEQQAADIAQRSQTELTGLQDYVGTTTTNLEKQAIEEQKNLTEALGGFGADQGGALGDLYSNLSNQKTQRAQDLEAQRAAIIQDLEKNSWNPNSLSASTIKAMGLMPGQQLYGLDVGKYLESMSGIDPNITGADVITGEQQQRLDVLSQLAGLEPGSINLGTKETPGFFAEESILQGLADAKAAFESGLKTDYLSGDKIKGPETSRSGGGFQAAPLTYDLNNRYTPEQMMTNRSAIFAEIDAGNDSAYVKQKKKEWLDSSLNNYLREAGYYRTAGGGTVKSPNTLPPGVSGGLKDSTGLETGGFFNVK